MKALALTRAARNAPPSHRGRDIDWPLVAGVVFFGGLVALAVYGPLVAPHDIYYSRALVDGKAPPFPPSPEYPFGSDSIGRDRFSWLLIGARATVVIAFAAAALRVIVGTSLGLIAGFRVGNTSIALRRLALALSSVPATIASVLGVIALGLAPGFFVLALGVVGWAEPFHQARRYARAESGRPFIESARSLGMSEWRVLFRHLVPNVAPALLTTAAFQVSAVRLLLAELAVLNLFVGGSLVIDYDARGAAVVVPRVPSWPSMLGTTRPIVSLYGDLAAVLLPGGAILIAVLATNLLGDALAARAQRLDVYRLFSRKHMLALVAAVLVISISVNVWPSRLAHETAYGRGLDSNRAAALAREIASLGSRPSGSPEAIAASSLLSSALKGSIETGLDSSSVLLEGTLDAGGAPIRTDGFTILSLDDADISGPLIYVDLGTFLQRPIDLAGAIVVVDQVGPNFVGVLVQRVAAAGARAVIVLDSEALIYRSGAQLYALPTLRVNPSELFGVLNQRPPDPARPTAPSTRLADNAHVRIRVGRTETAVLNVTTRITPADPASPLVLVVASYDSAPGTTTRWASATSAAALIAVVDRLRSAPIALDVIATATSADYQNFAGIRLALRQLSLEERGRLQAILVIGPLLSESLVVETQTDQAAPSGTGRLAARLHDALRIETSPRVAGDLFRAIQLTQVAASPMSFSATGTDAEPSDEAIAKAARAVLVALAYVPTHLSEMH